MLFSDVLSREALSHLYEENCCDLYLGVESPVSLRSKRFRRDFYPFAFRRRENWGERNTDGSSPFLRSPQFSRVRKAKNASSLRKAVRKRLLRRLSHPYIYVIELPCSVRMWKILAEFLFLEVKKRTRPISS